MFSAPVDSHGKLKTRVGYTNPEAWVFKGPVLATLKANICGECGYTELIADDPAALTTPTSKPKAGEHDVA